MTRSLTARTRLLAASAALLLVVGALAGCSDRPGQAADMQYTGLDGASHSVVVTEKDIDVVAKEMASVPGQPGQERLGAKRSEIASSLVEAPILVEVGKAHGLTVTDAQIVELAKEHLGIEPRQAVTISYLRAIVLSSKYQELSQQGQQGQVVIGELQKIYSTLDGDISPRYSNKAQTWLTQTDPRLESGNNPFGGGQQQAPQQQQQPQQQQAPQQGGQQTVPQEGAEQPADSGQTEGQTENEPADGGAGEGGQDAGQAEGNGR